MSGQRKRAVGSSMPAVSPRRHAAEQGNEINHVAGSASVVLLTRRPPACAAADPAAWQRLRPEAAAPRCPTYCEHRSAHPQSLVAEVPAKGRHRGCGRGG